jgi:ankyrin repeat protein
VRYLDFLKRRVTQVVDDKGFSLLHHAVLKNRPAKVALLLSYARGVQQETDAAISQWINAKTREDKFTPLHFAAFKGHLKMLKLLVSLGSSINQVNQYGLTMMHVAAQGDAATSLYFFKEMGLNINEKDKRGSSPLHWACYSQSEIAISYLLAWNPDLNS